MTVTGHAQAALPLQMCSCTVSRLNWRFARVPKRPKRRVLCSGELRQAATVTAAQLNDTQAELHSFRAEHEGLPAALRAARADAAAAAADAAAAAAATAAAEQGRDAADARKAELEAQVRIRVL